MVGHGVPAGPTPLPPLPVDCIPWNRGNVGWGREAKFPTLSRLSSNMRQSPAPASPPGPPLQGSQPSSPLHGCCGPPARLGGSFQLCPSPVLSLLQDPNPSSGCSSGVLCRQGSWVGEELRPRLGPGPGSWVSDSMDPGWGTATICSLPACPVCKACICLSCSWTLPSETPSHIGSFLWVVASGGEVHWLGPWQLAKTAYVALGLKKLPTPGLLCPWTVVQRKGREDLYLHNWPIWVLVAITGFIFTVEEWSQNTGNTRISEHRQNTEANYSMSDPFHRALATCHIQHDLRPHFTILFDFLNPCCFPVLFTKQLQIPICHHFTEAKSFINFSTFE